MFEQVIFYFVGIDVIVGRGDDIVVMVEEFEIVFFVYYVLIVCCYLVVDEFFFCCYFVVLVFQEYDWIWLCNGDLFCYIWWQDFVIFIDDCDMMFGDRFVY